MVRTHAPAARPLQLVFCARVIKEKGIEEAIAAVERLSASTSQAVAVLDVYGPIPPSYRRSFERLVDRSPNTTYRRVLRGDDLYCVLQRYDLMLFPTYYAGEGFPGTIVDAFIAGLPVVASDWKYNREIIEPGQTGAICSPRSSGALVDTLRAYVDDPGLPTTMRPHCMRRADEFHVDNVLP